MLLAKLREYAEERMPTPLPPLYSRTPVAWIIVLDSDGVPRSREPVSLISGSSARSKRGRDMVAPEVQRTSGSTPLLLADDSEYTFGMVSDPAKQDRATRRHADYRELLDRCAVETEEPTVLAVKRFFERGGADLLTLGEEWDAGLKVTFEVISENGDRQRPIDSPSVQEFWLAHNEPDGSARGQCLVCGESKPVLERLRTKIKGIRGGQSSGTSIISANAEAFESYGLKASRTAPTCLECAESFTRGLNHLLSDEHSRIVVGDATFVFWTREDTRFNLASFMKEPDAGEVRSLLESVRKDRRATVRDTTAFYAASLSASGGRAVVRDWIDTTVASAEENIARWFVIQRIADPRDEDPKGVQPRLLGLFQLAVSTVRTAGDLPVTTPRVLFAAALSGRPIPLEIAFQAVRRCRAEQAVTRPRAALIKLALLSQEPERHQEDYMVALEADHPSPAYHCGRLLAVIEEIQRAALPGVNATIVDRFYGAASSTPAVVFGALIRGAQPHLAKLERDKRGAYVNLQRRLEDVMGRIGDWPASLALREQALFSLGYYHQRAYERAEVMSRRAARSADGAKSNDDAAKE